jgi:hypothetical protein
MRNLLTPYEIAVLILTVIERYRKERGKEITRLRITSRSLHRLSGRQRLHGSLRDDVFEQLLRRGWTAFPVKDGGIAVIVTTAVEAWPRLSSRRVRKEIRDAANGHLDIDTLEAELGIGDLVTNAIIEDDEEE